MANRETPKVVIDIEDLKALAAPAQGAESGPVPQGITGGATALRPNYYAAEIAQPAFLNPALSASTVMCPW